MKVDPRRLERTPAFVLEHDAFKRNLEVISRLQTQVPARFILALKGFAMHAIFGEIASVVGGATASSLNEALLAAEYFDEVHAYAPAYIPTEFSRMAALSSHVTFNSLGEYHRYSEQLGGKKAGLRINPGYSVVATDLYNPCVPGSRLGIPPEELASLPEGISGLHVHNLCESGAEDSIGTLLRIEQVFGHLLPSISWLNLGGGHLVTRQGYDTELLVDGLRSFHERHPHIELILEPGAAFVWDTGVLVARVLDIVERGHVVSAMLDTSFATHMPDCLEMPYTPRLRGAKIVEKELTGKDGVVIRLGGASCLAGDWVGDYLFEQMPKVGDFVIFEDMMHYTMVKTTMFNGIALPDLCIWKNGNASVVRRSSYEDYRRRLS